MIIFSGVFPRIKTLKGHNKRSRKIFRFSTEGFLLGLQIKTQIYLHQSPTFFWFFNRIDFEAVLFSFQLHKYFEDINYSFLHIFFYN